MNQRIFHSDMLKENWDILIILDACRYDTFKELLGDKFLGSVIQEADSEASSTKRWLNKHFLNNDDFLDVVYVSGNPFINSAGVRFPSNLKFYKVYDSWKYRDAVRTEPVDVFYDAKKVLFLTRNRVIIHFLQPHYPYKFDIENINIFKILLDLLPVKVIRKLKKALKRQDNTLMAKIGNMNIEDTYKSAYSNKQIRKAYMNNIKSVLPFVKKLVKEEVNKTIIITSDHSEYLGENGRYGHGGVKNDFITRVPYVKIEV